MASPGPKDQLTDLKLARDLTTAALRYERMTAAVLQACEVLATTHSQAIEAAALRAEIERLHKYLGPHGQAFEPFFAGMLLTNVIAEVEVYFVEALRLLLMRYPKRMGTTQFALSDILDKKPEEIVLTAAEQRISKLMYKRPSEYLSELAETLGIEVAPISSHWPLFIEAKARRDLGSHNAWRVNETYRRKVAEAGIQIAHDGPTDMQPNFEYVRELISNTDTIVRAIRDQLDKRFSVTG
jgi:hypothetical protein